MAAATVKSKGRARKIRIAKAKLTEWNKKKRARRGRNARKKARLAKQA